MRKISFGLAVLLLIASAGGMSARAQGEARLSLYALQSDSFPAMTVSLDVFDAAGSFVVGLTPEQITLIEDGLARPVDQIVELQPGTQFALALDPGPAFAFRDADAVTRYQKIARALMDWAAAPASAGGDDLSVVTAGANASSHLESPGSLAESLAAYQPDLQTIPSSPDTLARALDVVLEPAPEAGMKRVVLYVTSVPSADVLPALENLTQRAIDQQVRVNVWIVASPDFFNSSGATALKDLASQTDGQYELFSGAEPLPSLDSYLAPLRHSYRLSYTSGILAAGSHSLAAQVNLDQAGLVSPAMAFELDVQPPNPILVSPPEQIVRQAADPRDTDFAAFKPDRQVIEAIIEFPDGHSRALVRTALYVDGVLVDERTAEPYDRFSWDLSGYTLSGEHTLQLEAVDSLGLSRVSLGLPVTVTVIRPQTGLLPFLARNSAWVAAAAILAAGAVLGLSLAWGRRKRVERAAGPGSAKDPLTQPVQAEESPLARRTLRLPWARPARQPDAYLVRLKEDGQPVSAQPIPVIVPEMTFGSDPLQATRILDDPSVSGLHARLKEEDGEYILIDERSTAGTWVNYERLSVPRRLQHGDLLHIGRISYRFMLRHPPEQAEPRRMPIKP
jgi:hypothetical protein